MLWSIDSAGILPTSAASNADPSRSGSRRSSDNIPADRCREHESTKGRQVSEAAIVAQSWDVRCSLALWTRPALLGRGSGSVKRDDVRGRRMTRQANRLGLWRVVHILYHMLPLRWIGDTRPVVSQ